MDYDADSHDDRAIALALAASELLDRPVGAGSVSVGWEPSLIRDALNLATPGYDSVL